ncbi:MAG: glycosyltransferase family 39 protein, partial [Salibacteraceae bacterium]|nr:glycosyltransferase family 39 protein [Salibacteraceae bacterium]
MAKDKKQAQKPTPDSSSNKWTKFYPIVLFVFSFLLYANTLNHGYVLDDISVISENRYVNKGFEGIGQIWKTSYRDGYWNDSGTLYRPIALTIFAIEWQLAPNNPWLAHFVNVLLYGALCTLLFFVLKKLLQQENVAFIASLLFAATALHTEVVANIKSLDEILSLSMGLLAWLFILKWNETKKTAPLIMALVAFLIGMFTKEG